MYKYIILFLFLFGLISCKSVKKIAERKEVPTITEAKLYKDIDENTLDYNSLFAKKIDVSIKRGKKENNLNGSLKIQRDSFIWLSLTAPLGIEICRLLITADSIKYVDSYNKKYLYTDYLYFYDRYGIKLSYDCLQNLLTNMFFQVELCIDNEVKDHKFKFEKSDEYYVLSNVHQRALDRKVKKFYKKKRKNKDYSLILQEVSIHPETFRPANILLKDLDEGTELNVRYRDFKHYEDILFPENLHLSVLLEKEKMGVEIKFSRLEFNTKVVPNIRISPKYKKINE